MTDFHVLADCRLAFRQSGRTSFADQQLLLQRLRAACSLARESLDCRFFEELHQMVAAVPLRQRSCWFYLRASRLLRRYDLGWFYCQVLKSSRERQAALEKQY